MINKQQLYLLSQIASSMEELVARLETAYNNKNEEEFEQYKKLILEFHKKLSVELGE